MQDIKLNNAIKHCLDVAAQCDAQPDLPGTQVCKQDHLQMAEWLQELLKNRIEISQLKDQINDILSIN